MTRRGLSGGGKSSAPPAGPACRSFPPSFDGHAVVLILGSMPGAESLRLREYYAFRHNAFWPIMGELFDFPAPDGTPYPERLEILRRAGVALWDVLAACERPGSLDSDIGSPRPNDIPGLLKRAPGIKKIICNGVAARRYLDRFFPDPGIKVVTVPSTSPAAATLDRAEKLACWRRELAEALPILRA